MSSGYKIGAAWSSKTFVPICQTTCYMPEDSIIHDCFIILLTVHIGSMQWNSWLRHCATSWKVVGSIPDGFIGIFHWRNPSGHTMALGLTQPLTEWVPGIFPGVSRWAVHRADNLTTFICWLSCNLGPSTSWNPQGLSRPVMELLFTVQIRVLWNNVI